MRLNINVSETMDKESKKNDGYEDRILRVPQACRHKFTLGLGDFVRLRNRFGGIETFQVAEAFKEDLIVGEDCVFTTGKVFSKLLIESSNKGDVEKVQGITLGCDPEVFLIHRETKNIMQAFKYFRKFGDVGHDGILLEFRPAPSTNSQVVSRNLWNCILKARRILNMNERSAKAVMYAASGCGGLTAGFHLHFGMPTGLLGHKPAVGFIARTMTRVFDYYVGIPSIIPEGDQDCKRRTDRHLKYGKPGGFRLDNKTFEFRMPGGVNMKHPLLAKGLLALGAVVAEDVASRISESTDRFVNLKEMGYEAAMQELYPKLPNAYESCAIICNPSTSGAINCFPSIKKDVRKMVGYKDRAAEVESYFECLEKGVAVANNLEIDWGGFYNA
jgi:hypothetical protein